MELRFDPELQGGEYTVSPQWPGSTVHEMPFLGLMPNAVESYHFAAHCA